MKIDEPRFEAAEILFVVGLLAAGVGAFLLTRLLWAHVGELYALMVGVTL